MMNWKVAVVVAAFSVCQIVNAGVVVNVDLQASSTSGYKADINDFVSSFGGGTYVNYATPPDFSSSPGWLTDSNGVSNAVSLDLSNTTSAGGMDSGGPVGSELLTDGWGISPDDLHGNSRTLTFGNLTPGVQYELVFYSWEPNHVFASGWNISAFNIGGISKTPNAPGNTVEFTASADAQGQIVATWYDPDTTDNDTALFCGLQIAEVPEPATLSLLAIGGLTLLRRRSARVLRRRRA